MAIGDNKSINIEINVVDGNGTVQTINATTAAVTGLGTAGSVAGQQLGTVGSGATAAQAQIKALGLTGASTWQGLIQNATYAKAATTGVTTAAQALTGGLQAAGAAGTAAGQAMGAGLKHADAHALTSLDNVRLLRDDFGIKIPRAMEKAIASSAMLSGAIRGVGTGFIALGAAEILFRIGDAAYKAYEKFIDIDSAAEDFFKTVQKHRDEDFVNTRSIEDTKARLDDATASARNFQKVGEEMHQSGWHDLFSGLLAGDANRISLGVGGLLGGRDAVNKGFEAQGHADTLTAKQLSEQHEMNILRIDAQHATDAQLKGEGKITAELAKQKAIHKENRDFAHKADMQFGNRSVSTAGNEKQILEDQQAEGQASAQRMEMSRRERDQVIQMQNAANVAGLEGATLHAEQERQAIDAITRKFAEGEISKRAELVETQAIRQKFYGEEMARLYKQQEETRKIAREAELVGLTGIAKIQAEHNDAIDKVNTNRDLTPEQAASQRASAALSATQKMTDAEDQYQQHVRELNDRTSGFMTVGYAKVDAELAASIAKRTDDFDKMYGKLSTDDDRYKAASLATQQDIVGYQQRADQERAQLHARSMQQIEATEIQAARTRETEDKAATGYIVDEYNQRVLRAKATLQQELAANKLTADEQRKVWEEYHAAIAASADLAAAQMERAAQQTRDRMATSLRDIFTDPAGYLKRQAEELMYKTLANGLMNATHNLEGTAGKVLAQILGMGPNMQAPVAGGTSTGSGWSSIFHPFSGDNGLTGASGTAAAGTALSTASTTLTTAGGTLSSAGSTITAAGSTLEASSTTLGASGTTLGGAGSALLSAAAALQAAAAQLAAAGTSGGGGGLGSIGGALGGLGGGGGADATGSAGGFSGDTGNGTVYSDAAGGFSPSSGMGSGGLAQTQASANTASATAAGGASSLGSTLAQGGGKLGKAGGIAGAAIAGGIGIYNAYQNSDPLGGAISGGLAGASIGGMIGGPVGMLIGGVIGGAAGAISGFLGMLFGDNGEGKARSYDQSTVAPALASEMRAYNNGQLGYAQAHKDLDALKAQAKTQTDGMGSGARHYFDRTISPEILAVQAKIDAEEKGGRGRLTMSAAQFHGGGLITGFRDFATSGNEGFIHALMGERVMSPRATANHGPILDAMEAGTAFTPSMLHGAARTFAGGSTSRLGGGGGTTIHAPISIHAISASSFRRELRDGLGKEIQSHLNQAIGDYGGKSLGN